MQKIIRPFGFKYDRGTMLTKKSGASWTGRVVGFYSTTLTPEGYCVESIHEKGSVQLYPEQALIPCVTERERDG